MKNDPEIPELNEQIRWADEKQVSEGRPILSVIVVHNDGSMNSVFWESVEKYNLRRPGEDDDALITRLREEAFAFYGKRT